MHPTYTACRKAAEINFNGGLEMVRRVLLMGFILAAFSANAGRITMSNPEQSTTANGQTLCVYSNSIYTFTYVTKSKHCPYSKSFNTVESE
jgi:hypothetical protein